MATRWEITKAVRASDLPAPSRLIMHTLASVAEVGTAEIPQQFTPSVSVLVNETGLTKRTVQTHLKALETEGWLSRTRPPTPEAMWRGDRVRYRLSIPVQEVHQEQEIHQPENGHVVSEPSGVVQEMHEGGAGDAPLELDQDQITTSTTTSSSEKPTKDERPDVEKICRHLADKIVDNGSKRPVITAKWRIEARLLLDKDGRTVDQVIKAIDWCQEDSFWRANIQSMPTLRAKYDTLRLQAGRARASPNGRPSTTDQRVAANLVVAAAFEAKEITA